MLKKGLFTSLTLVFAASGEMDLETSIFFKACRPFRRETPRTYITLLILFWTKISYALLQSAIVETDKAIVLMSKATSRAFLKHCQ